MQTTDLKYWVNGHQVRGGWFHTLNFSVWRIGVMFSWGHNPWQNNHNSIDIKSFWLV